ncbi:MAG: tyrosine-type recombinase/integrase [Sphingobacteriales bacterium]|nr:tyrosine-type recombinase/integrase [Sphingobacteriales bacterium]
MLKNGKSITTVGIYLRALRAIYNLQNIDRSLYPFGERAGGYSIPTGKNIKKALPIEDISKIVFFDAKAGTMQEMARDYWIFIYLGNGMNVKDFCLLKRKNISGNILTYQRAKTVRSKKEPQMITVSLKPEAKEVIRKWGVLSIDPESYLFPHLQKKMTAERQREVYQQVTKNINKYIKQIAKEVGINSEVTTYFARHSFATILKRTGSSVELVSELLGHSNTKITQSYLASFENEAIHKATDVLTQFKKAE